MNTNKDDALLFASETMIFRIASIAKIVSWVVLVIYLYSLIENIRTTVAPMFQQQSYPTDLFQWLGFLANLIFPIAIGLFYFVVLQGVAQGLNIGLDIFYELHPEADEEEVVVVEEK
jgi:hypothetical protein